MQFYRASVRDEIGDRSCKEDECGHNISTGLVIWLTAFNQRKQLLLLGKHKLFAQAQTARIAVAC
jgi:hypothetical protein